MSSLRKYLTRKFLGGIFFGTSAILVFGVFIWVQAVAPGAVTNPTFGPQNDDVVLQTPIFFKQSDYRLLVDSTACGDSWGQGVWSPVNLGAFVPVNARFAHVDIRCSESVASFRPTGSALSGFNIQGCGAGDNEADSQTRFIELNNNRSFDINIVGTDCGTRGMQVILLGYSS